MSQMLEVTAAHKATPHPRATAVTLVSAVFVLVGFLLMVLLSELSSAKGVALVPFTNAQVANTHPVYGLPLGVAFAIWGLIYLTTGLFTLYQALPSRWYGGLEDETVGSIRLYMLGVEACNIAWTFLFGNEQFWISLIVISTYAFLLFRMYLRIDCDYIASSSSWRHKLLVALPVSLHTAWLSIATPLQLQVNLLAEGWMPSPGFVVGLLLLPVTIACGLVFLSADIAYAFVAAWAMGWIIANQAPSSTFGCAEAICKACGLSAPKPGPAICERDNSSPFESQPNGWTFLNCSTPATNSSSCDTVVEKSDLVARWALAYLLLVLVALLAGIARGLRARYIPNKADSNATVTPSIGGGQFTELVPSEGVPDTEAHQTPRTEEVLASGV